MRKISKLRIKKISAAVVLSALPVLGFANDLTCPPESAKSLSVTKSGGQTAASCFAGRSVGLRYDNIRRTVVIEKDRKKTIIAKIDQGYTPDLIGMTAYIRFLPAELQPYIGRGVVLLNTIERSTSGEGGGQCGSGYEMYLDAVDISHSPTKPLGRVKIGSCLESTTLYDMENGPDDFSSFYVMEGKLAIKFLYLKGELETTTALLSDDFRNLNVITK